MPLCRFDVAHRSRHAATVAQGGGQQRGVVDVLKQADGIGMKRQGFIEEAVFPSARAEVVFNLSFQAFHLRPVLIAAVDG